MTTSSTTVKFSFRVSDCGSVVKMQIPNEYVSTAEDIADQVYLTLLINYLCAKI